MTFNLAFWLSLGIAVTGAGGLYLAGKGKWQGWAVGLAGQPVWFAFGIVTHGYGVCLTCLLYGSVYARNLLRARKTSVILTPESGANERLISLVMANGAMSDHEKVERIHTLLRRSP